MPVCGSFSYFTITLNQLLTPDTREYKNVCLYKDMGFTQTIYIIIALQIEQSYLMSAMKPCIYSELLEGYFVPACLAGHGSAMGLSLKKGRKRHLKSTMVDHGWSVNHCCQTALAIMVDHGLAKLF